VTRETAAHAAAAAAANVHHIVLPVPFGPGGVSCWLVEDDPLTLVDVGANWASSVLVLERALAERGRRIDDLERVVVTHHHYDHAGALEAILDRSGAELVADARLAPWFASYEAEVELDDRYMLGMLTRHGVPEAVHAQLRNADRISRAWGCAAEVTNPVHSGDTLAFADRSWTALFRPGHSPFDTIFIDAERDLAIVGDHLMENVESVPFISRPPAGLPDDPVSCALPSYLHSLAETAPLELELVLPGHGGAFADHAAVAATRMRQIEAGVEETLAFTSLAERPVTAYEVALATRPKKILSRTETTLSYVVGYLRLLLDAGAVEFEDDGGVLRFYPS
jgi:glyoxylase-like metal-dependent hydrolase (beta-lactamase superfamily II)